MLFCEFFPKVPQWYCSLFDLYLGRFLRLETFVWRKERCTMNWFPDLSFFSSLVNPSARLFPSNISTPWGRTQVPLAGRPLLCGTCFYLFGRGAQMLFLRQVCCLDWETTGAGISCGWFCWLPRWKINSWYKLLPSHLPRAIVQCLFKTTYMGTHY